jgi:hypothetical protein
VDAPLCATGDVLVTVESATAAFCRCMHGCGPGINATMSLRVENHTQVAIRLDWSYVRYTGVEDAPGAAPQTYEDRKGSVCCSPGLSRSYSCAAGEAFEPWDRIVAAGHTDQVQLVEHFDIASLGDRGRFSAKLGLLIDGVERTIDLAQLDLSAASPTCP